PLGRAVLGHVLADDLRPAPHQPADRGRRLPAPLGQQTGDRRTERDGVPLVGPRAGAPTAAAHLLLLPARVTALAARLAGRGPLPLRSAARREPGGAPTRRPAPLRP